MKRDEMNRFVRLLITFLICVSSAAFAWQPPSVSYHTSIRHIRDGGIGYDQGYTTLEGLFISESANSHRIPFLDLRAHLFNDGYVAANAGIGFRRTSNHSIYGFNAYYDFRNADKAYYNQMGFGFEKLSKSHDIRVNTYLPIGEKSTSLEPAQFAGFSGHEMLVSQQYQLAMKGATAEIGRPLNLSQRFGFYAALGPYSYFGNIGSSTWGAKARLKGTLGPYLSIEGRYSYDQLFHNKFQAQFTFKLPLPHENKSPLFSVKQMLEPVERQEIITISNREKIASAIDPETGNPFYFIFVDNMSHSEGTFESPYPTLLLAQNNSKIGDIIYVSPGDGTSQGMNQGITLKNNQKLFGSGRQQSIQSTLGTIVIPAQNTTAPRLTNPEADAITVAANNEISGFIITDALGHGIFGLNTQNISISYSTLSGSLDHQIHLEYNTAPGTAIFDHLTITDGDLNAIFIDSESTSMVATLKNSTIQDNSASFIEATFAGDANFTMTNNTIDNNSSSLLTFNGPGTVLISDNTFTNNARPEVGPVSMNAGTHSFSATIERNIIDQSASGAIRFGLTNTNSADLTVSHNTITNNEIGAAGSSLGSAIVLNLNGSTNTNAQLVLQNNVITGNGGNALHSTNGDFNTLSITATNNEISNNGGGGFSFDSSIDTFTFNANDNTILNGGDNGISTSGSQTIETANITLTNNEITGSTNNGNGLAFSHEGGTLTLTATNNTFSDNEGSGILFYSDGFENLNTTIQGNIISNNQNLGSNATGGIDLEQFTNLTATISDNILSSNNISGLFIGSTLTATSACLNMTGNNSSNGYTLSNDAGTFNVTPLNVDTLNTGTINTIGIINTVSVCP